MVSRLRGLWHAARRRPWLALWAAALLAAAGVSAGAGGRALWAASRRRAAEEALGRRDLADARARLERCLRLWPDDPRLRLLAARAARCDGDLAEADRQLASCQRLGGDRQAVSLERALLVAQQGRPAEVEGYLHARLREGPPDADFILEALARGYLHAQRLPEAQDCLDRWLALRPDCAPALLLRGQVMEWWNDLEEAVTSYRRAVAAAPGDARARRRLALALVRADYAREGVGHLEALREHGEDAELLLALARGRRCLGEADAANRLLDEVLRLQPRNAEALSERGKLALQTGRAGDAVGPLQQALALAPHDRETNYTWYLCLRRLGRDADAARALEAVRRINADLQRVSELRRRIAASPRDASLRCEVGLIFLRNGQTREGLRWLESALQIDPDHAEARQALQRHAGKDDRR